MAEDQIALCEQVVGGPAHLVGYSDGANIALLVALRRPDLVDRLVLISGVFHPDGWVVPPDLEGEVPSELVEAYAEVSPDGREHLPEVAAKVVAATMREG